MKSALSIFLSFSIKTERSVAFLSIKMNFVLVIRFAMPMAPLPLIRIIDTLECPYGVERATIVSMSFTFWMALRPVQTSVER